tara:strand:- start:19 stop:543 length:525 start_codon:yes stop_codon:yes gene_type:complete
MISIRCIELEDLPIIQKWRNEESLRKSFREYRDFSITQKKDWYHKILNDNRFEMYVIVDDDKNSLVGVCGLTYIDWVNRHCDLHFYIGEGFKWIDDKYAPEAIKIILKKAFHTFNMNKVWVEIYEIDKKKLDFFKNLNFKVDAELREHYFYEGEYHSSFILSLLKSDYDVGTLQ